ncbi:MAG: thioredoxin family protein [Ignavibacteriales bacterium]|nr:thioredoxin family protein [Ignavibacteriales bacterium]
MKKYFLPLFLLLISSTFAQSNVESNNREKFDPNRDPFMDLKNAQVEAKRANKKIMLDVGGEWCIWCHRLDAFIESSEEIKNYLHENFIFVKVNYSEENKNEKFLSRYSKIEGYPHLFVLDSKGKELHSQNTGLLEKEKSYDTDKIMEFLKKWTMKKS